MAMGGQSVFPDDAVRLATSDNAYGVFVYRGYAFVSDWDGGLVVARVNLSGV